MIKLIYNKEEALKMKEDYDEIFKQTIEDKLSKKQVRKELLVDAIRILISVILIVFFVMKTRYEFSQDNFEHIMITVNFVMTLISVATFLFFVMLLLDRKEKREDLRKDYENRINDFRYPLLVDFYQELSNKEILNVDIEKGVGSGKRDLHITVKNSDGIVEKLVYYSIKTEHSTNVFETEIDMKNERILIPYKNSNLNFEIKSE